MSKFNLEEVTNNDPYEAGLPGLLDIVEMRMIKAIPFTTDKFIFVYLFLLDHSYSEACDVLGFSSKNSIFRRVRKIRDYLNRAGFVQGYDFEKKWRDEVNARC